MRTNSLITLVLRIGLTFTYVFIAILCFSKQIPLGELSTGYLSAFGILSIAIAVWIISGKGAFLSSIISLLILIAIVVLNIEKSFVLFGFLQSICLNLALIFSYKLKTVAPVIPEPVKIAEKSAGEDKAETLL